jgi:drug/metabolite transporter (DMT)-like permease
MTVACDTAPQNGARSGRLLGTLLVLGSAVAFSLTGTLTKAIHADLWVITCWRGLAGAVLIAGYVWVRRRLRGARPVAPFGWRGWVLATVGSAASIAFIGAFKLTYVANVTLIYATAPFVAALLERLILGERVRRATMVAAALSFCGVAVMMAGGLGALSLAGDALALAMTVGSALYMVLIRAFRDTGVVLAAAASSLQLFALGWLVSDPLAVSRGDALILAVFGVSFALAVILWTEGTRLIAAADSGLAGTAEIPLAVAFAWLIVGELPPAVSLGGGPLVLTAVFGLAWYDYGAARKGQ